MPESTSVPHEQVELGRALMWRLVRDRERGYAHAVPADFDAPTWYAVCLHKISSATAATPVRRR